MAVRLIERYLTEDIDAVRNHPQFKDIPSNVFDEIIETDPTFKPSSNSVGKYGKWLLSLYKKDGLFKSFLNSDNEQMKSEFIRNIKKTITKYEEYKNDRTKVIEKDIMKFKSVQDMANAIKNAGEAELSDKQKQRQTKKDKPYDLVFSGDVYDVYVPRNHEGDMVLASFGGSKKATWCTAADSELGREYYDKYLKKGGKYYVLINRNDYDDKYQFHFETEQFNNWDQTKKNCLKEIIRKDDKLWKFFYDEGYGSALPKVERLSKINKKAIVGARLLTKKEVQTLLNEKDRIIGEHWWLSTAGDKNNEVFYVNYDGEITCEHDVTCIGCVRPVLMMDQKYFDLSVGEGFNFGNRDFFVISDNLALCDDITGFGPFRKDGNAPDANNYEKSDIKVKVDNWFNKAYAEYKDDTPKTESYRRIHMREI